MERLHFVIYDGRYIDAPDDAFILSVCDSLEEAIAEAPDFGNDCVIVKETSINNVIVESEIIEGWK